MKKLVIACVLLLPISLFAQSVDYDCEGKGVICNPLIHQTVNGEQVETLPQLLNFLLDLLVRVSIPIITVAIIWTGFVYATSKGDPTKLKKAHAMALYIVLGAGLVFLSKGLQLAIQSTIDTLK
jgi:hypothetical protein